MNKDASYDAVYKGVRFKFYEEGAVVVGVEPGVADVSVPRSVRKHPVIAIGDAAFWGLDCLESVVVRASITDIGDWAFFDCTRLREVVLPDSVVSIGVGAFRGCSSLETFVMPISIKHIGYAAFAECISLVDVNMPDTPVLVPTACFRGCSSLKIIELPPGTPDVPDMAFSGCTSLMSFSVPDGAVRIGRNAFSGCTSLECVLVKDTVMDIGVDAFKGCVSLRALAFADNVKLTSFGGFFDEENAADKNLAGSVYRYTSENDGFEFVCPLEELPSVVTGSADKKHGSGHFKPVTSTGVTFDDIAGLDEAKDAIRRQLIYPFVHRDLYARYKKKSGGGLLLYGPAGTGKTMLAQAVANEVHGAFFSVKFSDIISKFDGEAEERIKDLFDTARSYPVSVIFFDEFDSIGRSRGNYLQPWRDDTLNELLAQVQGFEGSESTLLVMAATNRPWDLDSSLLRPGRFGTRVFVPLPDERARHDILKSSLEGVPIEGVDLREVASSLVWFSGSDVSEFAEQMKMCAILRAIESGDTPPLCPQDVAFARNKVKSTVTRKDMDDFEHFAGPLKW